LNLFVELNKELKILIVLINDIRALLRKEKFFSQKRPKVEGKAPQNKLKII